MASRGPAQPAGRNQKSRKVGGAPRHKSWPRGEPSARLWSAAPHRPPPVQQLAPASSARRAGVKAARWGLGQLPPERGHRPVPPPLLPSPPSFPQPPERPYLRIHSRSRWVGRGAWGR
nr:uncharacterized protein LOC106842667 [Equus asinus]